MATGSTGILKYFRPVESSSSLTILSMTTPTLPDPDGPLSERVPTKTIELANAKVNSPKNHHVDKDCHVDAVLCTIKVILV